MVKISSSFWKNKRVLLTGHTGFKGSWLLLLLLELGSEVWGFSHKYEKNSLFDLLLKEKSIDLNDDSWKHFDGDILDVEKLEKVIGLCEPDVVIHMAAQAIVRTSYAKPIETWQTNLNGTLNLLNALRINRKKCLILVVTTDKVYENNNNFNFFKEEDKLGGYDPYSASKAAVEIAVSSWRKSFLNLPYGENNLKLATARAGNVIGGGDNAMDRIVPDIVRSLLTNKKILVRNPNAIRPWQHVLESLSGYLALIQKLSVEDNHIIDCFNFGPKGKNSRNVKELVEEITRYWYGEWEDVSDSDQFYESKAINLNISKAQEILNWEPVWNFEVTVEKTIMWYRNYYLDKKSAIHSCMSDIDNFMKII